MKRKFVKSLLAFVLSAAMAFPVNAAALASENENSAVPQEAAAPSLANGEDGVYTVNVTTGESMFKIAQAVLTVSNGQMSAVLTFNSTSYSYLYAYGKEVVRDTATNACSAADKKLIISAAGTELNDTWIAAVENGAGGETFTVPVLKLDVPLGFGSYSASKAQWYGRAITFSSADAVYIGEAPVVGVTGISVTPSEKTLGPIGAAFTLAATVAPANATNRKVTFSSNDSTIASVDASTGVVTAVAAGTATITATTSDGGYTASCVVTASTEGEATENEKAVASTLSMFSFKSATAEIQSDGNVKIQLVTSPVTRRFDKIALVEQTASQEDKEAAAIVADSILYDGTKPYSTFTFTVPVSKIGTQLPVSFYQTNNGVSEWHTYNAQHYLTILNTPDIVGQLIDSIYVQEDTPATSELCTAAKACWDALTVEDKEKVSGLYADPDYFGRDTGDASKDDPRNQDAIGEKEILVVSFGTSFNESRAEDIGGIEKALETAYSSQGYSVRRAFTAQVIINHIQARDNEVIDNITEAMDRAVENGVAELVVQPTHLMNGAEYDEFCAVVNQYKSKIRTITIGSPLLAVKDPENGDYSPVSEADYQSVIKVITDETAEYAADPDTAVIFMGHGTEHAANKVYEALQKRLTEGSYSHYYIGTVEGKPASTEVTRIISEVKAAGYTKVVLHPLMVVAGDHANNDMAGDDDDSWKSQFTAADLTVTTVIEGLGRISGIQALYVQHTQDAIDGEELPFDDVNEDDWFNEAVQFVFHKRIMTGMDGTTFGANITLSRAHFATILYRMEGSPDVVYSSKFPDVPDGIWYSKAVIWTNQAKIVNGYDNGYFGTADSITREQMAVMMYRYAQYKGYNVTGSNDLSSFPDASSVSDFAKTAVQWAVDKKIITGDRGSINPQGNADRAQCAAIIMHFIKGYE